MKMSLYVHTYGSCICPVICDCFSKVFSMPLLLGIVVVDSGSGRSRMIKVLARHKSRLPAYTSPMEHVKDKT